VIETEPRTANGMRKSMNASSDVEIPIDIGNSKVALYFTPRQYAKLMEVRINNTPVTINLVEDAHPAKVRMSWWDGHMDVKLTWGAPCFSLTPLDVTLVLARSLCLNTVAWRGIVDMDRQHYEVIE